MTKSIKFNPFVPAASAVLLSGFPASAVVPVYGVGTGGATVTASCWVTGSARAGWHACDKKYADGLAVFVKGRVKPLVCLFAAFGGSRGDFASVEALRASAASAGASGAVVYPLVAVSDSGVAASGFLCGLASEPTAGGEPLKVATPVVGSYA